jgi:23S rRNA (cytosine1962-C5)-methyltransferase
LLAGAARVKVTRRGADRVLSGHPWIFASDVIDPAGAEPGSTVFVEDPKGRFLGTAHYSSASQIALRIISRQRIKTDHGFFEERLRAAVALRDQLVRDTDAFRVVFGEADLLPGLVVDCYGRYLVVQQNTQAMDRHGAELAAALHALLRPAGILFRNDGAVRDKEKLPREVRASGPVPDSLPIRMNGIVWEVDLARGQKTGLFLDQRENHAAVARLASGVALDCFTSSGGFALALAGVCERVEALDASAAVLERAKQTAANNGIGNVEFREAEVFQALAVMMAQRRHFDTIVLDPPAFAKSKSALDQAMTGYKEINVKALKLLKPGGVLVTCSCSQHVSEAEFLQMLGAAALDTGRTLRILERRTQAADHPVLLTVPETHYLKCIVVQALEAS